MGIEIERKFLVKSVAFKKESFKKNYLKQGYLNADKNRTVRIRISDETAYITIKGKSNTEGTSRFEWEKEIPIFEAEELMLLCEPGLIEKYRYLVKKGKHTFEVDEFLGDNLGLIVAEIELNSEKENFERPIWLAKEVTGESKYYNSSVSKFPFKSWT
ncbi:CYTH domain-containing protein [Polaribacter sp. IC073]|uniref:CYTH domain-containing protein n=1 Tax=Polaribacter sp. IC073 TaxID=2508540 RepID=UPI0011BD5E98|nr:CYTH domain-containing protein [Polaribacter sp. IC073]TXD49734.1 CYTH domain-containing protein [Polaribacter sp. IC073]